LGNRSNEIANKFKDKKNIIGCEVGVRFGKNAEQLLEKLPGLHITLVDRWCKPPEGDSFWKSGDGIAQRPAGHLRKAYHETLRRTERFGDRVKILKLPSVEASKQVDDNRFDFVFLDADHSYDGVRVDIIHWLPKVKPGGWLCGHDYNHPKIGEVARAVDELMGNSVLLGTDMTWFYQKP